MLLLLFLPGSPAQLSQRPESARGTMPNPAALNNLTPSGDDLRLDL